MNKTDEMFKDFNKLIVKTQKVVLELIESMIKN
jgi:hypothetical protein